jgi:A/G-specific adenine glycosylase
MIVEEHISVLLLAWWDAGHADLPWRRTKDPYAIWVAEVMLQQTQIATVIPYFTRWLVHFPTVERLASASLGDVLKMWEGLGYYSRARHLHEAAQIIVADFGSRLPDNEKQLQSLPGIGRYTAGAIASIAFDRPVAIVDGNITRVLTRLYDLPGDVTLTATRKQLWQLAGELAPIKRPGAYNQALMELGQNICQPAKPQCHRCPLAELCQARSQGTQLERPVRPPRKKIPHYEVTAAVIWRDDGQLLIAQRPLDGLLGGLWEFPGGKQETGETLAQALRREIDEELGIEIAVGRHLATIKHAYSHFRITLTAFHTTYVDGQPLNLGVADHAWVDLVDLDKYAFAATDRQIINALQSEKNAGLKSS